MPEGSLLMLWVTDSVLSILKPLLSPDSSSSIFYLELLHFSPSPLFSPGPSTSNNSAPHFPFCQFIVSTEWCLRNHNLDPCTFHTQNKMETHYRCLQWRPLKSGPLKPPTMFQAPQAPLSPKSYKCLWGILHTPRMGENVFSLPSSSLPPHPHTHTCTFSSQA